jgi:hemoglobin
MKDIENRNDIIHLVDSFYDKVKADELLAPIFVHLDWPKHMPTMYNFWSSMMFGENSYQGNPFQKHIHLKIDTTHFAQWLNLFQKTVDENFTGYNATEIKSRAQNIARLFQHRLGLSLT